jgi:WD40 repeat protein
MSLDGHVVNRIPCESRVESLEFIPGDSILMVPNRRPAVVARNPGEMDEIVELWEDGLGRVRQNLDGAQTGRPSRITTARTSPCGKLVLAGERYQGRAYLFDRTSGRVIAETPVSRDRLMDVAYSPDGKAIAIGYRNGRIEYFELQTDANGNPSIESRPLVLDAHQGEVMSVKFVDAATLASCGTDGLVRIWSLSGLALRNLDLTDSEVKGVELSPDGALLLYSSADELGIAKSDSGEVRFRSNDPAVVCRSTPTWSPTGDRFAVRLRAPTVTVCDRDGRPMYSIAHGDWAEDLAFSPDDSLVAVISNNCLQICNSKDGREVFRKPLSGRGSSIAFSHHGMRLAYSQNTGELCIFDVSTRRPLRELQSGSEVFCVAFSPDDTLLATGHGDTIIRLWEVATGTLKGELMGHELAIDDLTFSRDGRTLLSASDDGSVRLWSVDHARPYGVLCQHFKPGTRDALCRLSLSSDGRLLAVGYRTPQKDLPDVLLWKIDAADPR